MPTQGAGEAFFREAPAVSRFPQGMPQPGMPGPVSAPGMSDAFASGLPLGVGTSAGPGLPHLPMSMPPQGLMHPQDGP